MNTLKFLYGWCVALPYALVSFGALKFGAWLLSRGDVTDDYGAPYPREKERP